MLLLANNASNYKIQILMQTLTKKKQHARREDKTNELGKECVKQLLCLVCCFSSRQSPSLSFSFCLNRRSISDTVNDMQTQSTCFCIFTLGVYYIYIFIAIFLPFDVTLCLFGSIGMPVHTPKKKTQPTNQYTHFLCHCCASRYTNAAANKQYNWLSVVYPSIHGQRQKR